MISKLPGSSGTMRVTFALPASFWADTIHLVGDFNNWSTTATPLHLEDARWCVTLELEKNRSYHYRYLVNQSEWLNDWGADALAQSAMGGENSVVITRLSEELSSSNGGDIAPAASYERHRPSLRLIQGGRSDEKEEKQAV